MAINVASVPAANATIGRKGTARHGRTKNKTPGEQREVASACRAFLYALMASKVKIARWLYFLGRRCALAQNEMVQTETPRAHEADTDHDQQQR